MDPQRGKHDNPNSGDKHPPIDPPHPDKQPSAPPADPPADDKK